MDTLVLLEAGTRLPTWVDHEAGSESNVYVLSERPEEGPEELEARALSLAEKKRFPRTLLVCNGQGGRRRTSVRSALILELGGRFVLVTTAPVTPELRETAQLFGVELRVEFEAARVEAEPVRRVA